MELQEMLLQALLAVITVVVPILGTLVGRAVNKISNAAETRLGIELSQEARNTIHSAALTGAKSVVASFAGKVLNDKGVHSEMVAKVVGHIKGGGAGDSVRMMNADDKSLVAIAERYIKDEVGKQ